MQTNWRRQASRRPTAVDGARTVTLQPASSTAQQIARYLLIGALVVLGAWMLRHFLPALCWAVVLAIATSKLYERWLSRFTGRQRHLWAALTFTTFVGVVLIVPLAYGGFVGAREALVLVRSLTDASGAPPELPRWVLT